jgi:hypothetical protein
MGKHQLLVDNHDFRAANKEELAQHRLDIGDHGAAIEINGHENRRDLVLNSFNAFVNGANALGCTPHGLAAALVDQIEPISHALITAHAALESLRHIMKVQNDLGFFESTWDPYHGLPGHALELLKSAMDHFPVKLEPWDPDDVQPELIRELRDYIVGDKGDALMPHANDLVERANRILGE